MKEPIVADSTCLIGLERIDALDILPAMFEPIWAPPEVGREFGVAQPWLKIEAPTDAALVAALKLLVDDGEAEALALAVERGLKVVLDDRQARDVAKRLGLRMIGTVGCPVKAKREGLVAAVGPLIEALEAQGFFLSEALKVETLRLAGE